MPVPFSLVQNPLIANRRPFNSIVPSEGEDWGLFFQAQADKLVEEHQADSKQFHNYWAPKIAQLYSLAADAWDLGALASIGHNRTARYEEAARRCREKMEKVAKMPARQAAAPDHTASDQPVERGI